MTELYQVRLARLRHKLDELRERVGPLRLFGAGVHQFRESPVLDERALAALEARYGVRLPEELRAFLQTMHAGGPGPAYGLLAPIGDEQRVAEPFPYGNAEVAALIARRATDRSATLPLVDENVGDDWPPGGGFLPLAHLGCGVFDVIITAGEQRGTVWSCDMKWLPHHRLLDSGFVQLGFFDWYEHWLDRSIPPG